jgi:hypothetical protein
MQNEKRTIQTAAEVRAIKGLKTCVKFYFGGRYDVQPRSGMSNFNDLAVIGQ